MKKNINPLFIALLAILMQMSCQQANQVHAGQIHNLSVNEFKSEMGMPGAALIDVRTPEEFNEGHIAGAINIDWNKRTFRNYILNVPADKPAFIYCRSGNRSGKAALAMQALGFDKIYNLEKGIKQWIAEGQPVTKEDSAANRAFQQKAKSSDNDVAAAIKKAENRGMGKIHDVDNAGFQKAMAMKDAILVDVRTPEEYAAGHLAGAKNIDWKKRTFSDLISEINKDKPVLIYCRSGNRSGKAASAMQALGFKNIYNLDHGIKGWLADGLPVK